MTPRRAVSPLLATVILIVIVVAAGVMTYGLISGMFGALAPVHTFEATGVDLVKASTGGMLSITVKNTGSATAALVKVSVATDAGTVEAFSGSTKRFFLVCVDGVSGSWVDPATFYQGAVDVLSQAADATVARVSTLADLDNLVRNPPEGIVVINCHGERMPRPTSWPDWQSYYDALANAVVTRGWIFVTADGYPLFYTQLEAIGPAGLNRFLSAVGASADAWGNTAHSPTAEGTEALSRFGIAAANPLSGVRTVAWSGTAPSFRFYVSDYDGGRYAAAFAYWLADKNQLRPGQTCSLTLTGLQVTAGEKYAVTVTVAWIDGSASSKSIAVACTP